MKPSLATARNCPNCNADLRGDPIPEDSLYLYNHGPDGELIHSPGEYAEVRDRIENETTHFRRVIGIEYAGGYDGVSEWRCPDCGLRECCFTGRELGADES